MELSQRIRQARLEAGLSQRQLCGQTITRNMLSQIENGSARPSMSTLQYLAAQLGKPVSYFLDEAAASPNQARMDTARAAFLAGDPAGALENLSAYTVPDPVFDPEKHLLEALCCILLSEARPDAALLQQAAEAGSKTPYYTPELERRRLLCLARTENADLSAIAAALPPDDRVLLLQAKAALQAGDPQRCAALLNAAQDQSAAHWLILRADATFASGDYALAIELYTRANSAAVYPKLEQCFLRMEDYKMAYYYACLQR